MYLYYFMARLYTVMTNKQVGARQNQKAKTIKVFFKFPHYQINLKKNQEIIIFT